VNFLILYMPELATVILSICLSVLVSHPGTVPNPDKIRDFRFSLYDSLVSLVFWDKILCP